jgi:hypothetical protein
MRMPERIARLPLTARGYPALFFAAVVDGEPDIRRVSAAKFHRCVKERLCWLCGEALDEIMVFVVSKQAAESRIWFEPPCHRECAEYALAVCPFIADPTRRQRNGTPHPGEYVLYETASYQYGRLHNSYPIGVIALGPRIAA